jgi:nucleotide-binding universal stress UspA family protein
MKTFIVPTDFSEIAKNAAMFAAGMAASLPGSRVILYHVFPGIYAGSDSSPLNDDSGARKKIFDTGLASIKADMSALGNISITTIAEEHNSFIEALQNLVIHEKGDLIVMGITGTSKLDIFIGSSTLSVVNKKLCPVIIVPPQARFSQIRNVMLATDLKDIDSSTPVKYLKGVLDLFKPSLHIVNISSDPANLSAESLAEKAKLENHFQNYDPKFYFIKDNDVINTLDQFARDNNMDVIITVPRKHALNGLFQTSHTKKLAYHTHLPMIAIHE